VKLYYLERKGSLFYDEMSSLVVRARSNKVARQLAAASCGDEGEYTWKDPKQTSCKELK
jgi:hypothetical protein